MGEHVIVQVFIMAVHEQHPFVFFDCDGEAAKEVSPAASCASVRLSCLPLWNSEL